MIIHISQQRYEFIKSQGYNLTYCIAESGGHQGEQRYFDGDTTFHLLDDEHGFCGDCRAEFDSVDANSAAELETIKRCPAEQATIALRNLRQDGLLALKRFYEGKTA